MMLNKRGSTLAMEEVVKFILGVIVIVFLFFLAFELFKIISYNVKEEQARNTLDNIVYQIENGVPGQRKELLIEGPKDWLFMNYENEICFCEYSNDMLSDTGTDGDLVVQKAFYTCKKQGVCRKINNMQVFISPECKDMAKNMAKIGAIINMQNIFIQSCVYIKTVPLMTIFEFNTDAVEIYLKTNSGASPANVGMGLQNKDCKLFAYPLFYDQELSAFGLGRKIEYLKVNFSQSNCNLNLLRSSNIEFHFTCRPIIFEEDDELFRLEYYGNGVNNYNKCSINGIKGDEVSFSCITESDILSLPTSLDILKELDERVCDLEIIINWFSAANNVDGRTAANWKGLIFKPDKKRAECDIDSIKYLNTDMSMAKGGIWTPSFSFETSCNEADFNKFMVQLKYENGNFVEYYDDSGIKQGVSGYKSVYGNLKITPIDQKNLFEVNFLFEVPIKNKGYFSFVFSDSGKNIERVSVP